MSVELSNPVKEAIPAASITHLHILSIINTERPGPRILDVGCGSGKLTRYLAAELERLTGTETQVEGLDVTGTGFDLIPGFFGRDVRIIRDTDPWPYASEYFDCVISNQVVEHVKDLDFFLSQVARVLRPGGISVHLFPLRNVLWEDHVKQPFAHWISNHDFAKVYTLFWSHLGVGNRNSKRLSHAQFSDDVPDSLFYYCFYRSYQEVIRAAKYAGLRISLRYSTEFYIAKMRSLIGLRPRFLYRRRLLETIPARVLSFVSCITLFLEKTNVHT